MKKIFFAIVSIILIVSCGEEKKGNGEIVQQENNSVKDTAEKKAVVDTSVLVADTKDELKLKGGTKISYITHGTGKGIGKGTMVLVKYKTFLPDGKAIDGSDILGRPLPYFVGINMSVKGWDEAFVHLRVGDVIKLHLPSEKAYGKKGFGKMVPPDTDLDFDIEILELVKPEVTASGLKIYRMVEVKEGKLPKEGQSVEMHYYGWVLEEGKLYDSSHFNGVPHKFKVGGGEEILAWEEIAPLMKRGEKFLIVVPAELAYAEKGVPELVPPNSKLVFIMEMMNILS